MSERPILFNTEMVHAILEEQKTQTRRVVQPKHGGKIIAPGGIGIALEQRSESHISTVICPFGQVGDHLWVRETWQHSNHPYGPLDRSCDIFYREEYFDDPHGMDGEKSPEGKYRTWRPSIHMPRWASRITLEITGLRVERLQDISQVDCVFEGAHGGHGSIPGYPYSATPLEHYRYIWESINGTGLFDANPWVWVIEFKVVKS